MSSSSRSNHIVFKVVPSMNSIKIYSVSAALSVEGEYPYISGIGSPREWRKSMVATSLATTKYPGVVTRNGIRATILNLKPSRMVPHKYFLNNFGICYGWIECPKKGFQLTYRRWCCYVRQRKLRVLFIGLVLIPGLDVTLNFLASPVMARDLKLDFVSPPPSHTVASCNLQLPGFSPPQACLIW
jgi:hypothetical protein